MATTKKATETFTKKTVGELRVGDRFREVLDPARDLPESPWQEIVFVEKTQSSSLEVDGVTHKEIVACKTKIEGNREEFFFQAFSKVEVEVLDA